MKELISWVPFASYFFSCEPIETVTIKIFERFDNGDFGLESMDLLVPNEALQFKEARVRVRTELTGVRYLMHSWFITVALVFIFASTCSISIFAVILVLLMKRLYLLSWL